MADAKGHTAHSQIVGLGALFKQFKLRVPRNQRDYAWTRAEVTTLLTDFSEALQRGQSDYFLGTIVTIPRGAGELEVVDGQQRLATTAILLAEIRNHLKDRDSMIARSIEDTMLCPVDRNLRTPVPKLQLNVDDNEFFRAIVTAEDLGEAQKASHKRLATAVKLARSQVRKVVSTVDDKAHGDVLNGWLDFVEQAAQVILVQVPSEANAYQMFETLNDRGLRTSQADLVKNYLFGQARDDRLNEAQQKWAAMRGALDSLPQDDITVGFLRTVLMLSQGYLRETEVYDRVQKRAKGQQATISFLAEAETLAHLYVSILQSDNERWNGHPSTVRRAIETLNRLNVRLMRPLMVAVAARFNPKETAAAFERFVGWEARFLIAANTRTGGDVELPVSHAAKKVYDREITNAKALAAELVGKIPGDEEFKSEFAVASVNKANLARYYLRAIERFAKGEPDPFYLPNDDQTTINLEHILPHNPEGNWPGFDEEEVRQYTRRLGNQALLKASQNSDLKSSNFDTKKTVYAATPYELTSMIAGFSEWGPEQIETRQSKLADLALKTWPL